MMSLIAFLVAVVGMLALLQMQVNDIAHQLNSRRLVGW
jgi:Tfp pilus assembly protein PilV